MNDYKVIATGIYGEHTVTAIDEKDARREFRARHKGEDVGDIHTVTLIRENVPATKAQEREDLEKIKAIVATLGPRSYVGTALDGCLEDAEVNIENDFGDSMKARWQDAEKRVAQAVKETAEAKEELEAVRKHIQTAEDDANFYRDKVLDSDDIADVFQLVGDKLAAIQEDIKTAAERIIEGAEEPESDAFKNAVKYHRAVKGGLEYYQALAQRVKHARGQ